MNQRQMKALFVLTAALALNPIFPVSAGHNLPNVPYTNEDPLYPTPTALQGRRHPSYQVFAAQMQLPPIGIQGNRIVIEGRIWIEGTRLHRLPWRPRLTIAQTFGVPIGVVDHWLINLLRQPPLSGEALAHDLCATVIDYHYLKSRWLQYRPPTATLQELKDHALFALEAGELNLAWEMYYSLSRPGPPTL